MKENNMKKFTIWIVVTLFIWVFLPISLGTGAQDRATISIHIIYAPESGTYLPERREREKEGGREWVNPVRQQPLGSSETIITVTGESDSSGVVATRLWGAIEGGDGQALNNVTIFQPSVSHWLQLVNFLTEQEVFDVANTRGTANAPVVIAIWESRLQAVQQTVGYSDIGWTELFAIADSPRGWNDYGIDGRQQVYYGHTDPLVSSTGLSTLISSYYVAAQANNLLTDNQLTYQIVRDPEVISEVQYIQTLVQHYSSRTTEFKHYISQGPDYIDFVALEENDLIDINRGLTRFTPPEKLVALYPKEGTFIHEHPMGIVNASWVSPQQRDAANAFIDFVLQPAQQQLITEQGFRPVSADTPLSQWFDPQYGVTVEGPTSIFAHPSQPILADIQNSWLTVQKPSDIVFVIDVSGSMAQDARLDQVKLATLRFLSGVQPNTRVGIISFSTDVVTEVELTPYIGNEGVFDEAIASLKADGETALFRAILTGIEEMDAVSGDGRIRIIIVLTDGENTDDSTIRQDILPVISDIRDSSSPIFIVPVYYGDQDSPRALRDMIAISDASGVSIVTANPDNIVELLDQVGSLSGN